MEGGFLTIGPPGKSLNRLFIQTFKFSIFPKFMVSVISCDHIISHLWKDTKKKTEGKRPKRKEQTEVERYVHTCTERQKDSERGR